MKNQSRKISIKIDSEAIEAVNRLKALDSAIGRLKMILIGCLLLQVFGSLFGCASSGGANSGQSEFVSISLDSVVQDWNGHYNGIIMNFGELQYFSQERQVYTFKTIDGVICEAEIAFKGIQTKGTLEIYLDDSCEYSTDFMFFDYEVYNSSLFIQNTQLSSIEGISL